MVEISKLFIKNIIIKNLEYQDYNNYITIFITITVSLLIFFLSTILLFWTKLTSNMSWLIIVIWMFLSYEIIFLFLLFYFNKQKKDKKTEIEKLK